MKALLRRERMWGSIALCCAMLSGCAAKPDAAPQAASQAALPQTPQTPEQRLREQARVIKIIKEMTPEQRTAYFKAHPEDVAALAP